MGTGWVHPPPRPARSSIWGSRWEGHLPDSAGPVGKTLPFSRTRFPHLSRSVTKLSSTLGLPRQEGFLHVAPRKAGPGHSSVRESPQDHKTRLGYRARSRPELLLPRRSRVPAKVISRQVKTGESSWHRLSCGLLVTKGVTALVRSPGPEWWCHYLNSMEDSRLQAAV